MDKRIQIVLGISTIMIIILLAQCTYHNEDEYFKDNPNLCYTDNMSFSNDISPMVQESCISCHGKTNASAGINLEGYDQLKPYAESGLLSKVIRHESGVTPMPLYEAKWSDCSIEKFEAWVEQGMKNN